MQVRQGKRRWLETVDRREKCGGYRQTGRPINRLHLIIPFLAQVENCLEDLGFFSSFYWVLELGVKILHARHLSWRQYANGRHFDHFDFLLGLVESSAPFLL